MKIKLSAPVNIKGMFSVKEEKVLEMMTAYRSLRENYFLNIPCVWLFCCMYICSLQASNELRGQKRERDPYEMELAITMSLKPNPGFFDFLELEL